MVQRSFSDERISEIWNIDPCCEVRSALILIFFKKCLHKNIPSKSPCGSGFDLFTTNCIWYISLVSFWDYFNTSTTFHTRYANLGFFDPILGIMTSELGLQFQNFWNLHLGVNIFASKFLYILILILLSPFVPDVRTN